MQHTPVHISTVQAQPHHENKHYPAHQHHNVEALLVDTKLAEMLKKLGFAKDEIKPKPTKETLLVDEKVAELLKGLNLAED